jgi:hypothetical protein
VRERERANLQTISKVFVRGKKRTLQSEWKAKTEEPKSEKQRAEKQKAKAKSKKQKAKSEKRKAKKKTKNKRIFWIHKLNLKLWAANMVVVLAKETSVASSSKYVNWREKNELIRRAEGRERREPLQQARNCFPKMQ